MGAIRLLGCLLIVGRWPSRKQVPTGKVFPSSCFPGGGPATSPDSVLVRLQTVNNTDTAVVFDEYLAYLTFILRDPKGKVVELAEETLYQTAGPDHVRLGPGEVREHVLNLACVAPDFALHHPSTTSVCFIRYELSDAGLYRLMVRYRRPLLTSPEAHWEVLEINAETEIAFAPH